MNFRFIVKQIALNELKEIRYWYESQRSGLEYDFSICINNSTKLIKQMPYAYPLIYKNIRRAPVKRFPYKIYYIAEDFSISVLSIFHNSRDFNAWKKLH